MKSRILLLAATGLAALTTAGRAARESAPADSAAPAPASAEAAPAHGARPRPNLLFVSFDTLRRDHVSCYGHDVITTPTVDKLAAEGLRFTDCAAVVPITGPSHATMMTGLYPQAHGAFRNGVRLPEDKRTLAEILREQGFRTGASLSGWTMRAQQCGLSQGFDAYDDAGMDQRYAVVNLMRRADAVTTAALKWMDDDAAKRADAPWFLFVHYFDPHEPYDAPREIALAPNPARSAAPRTERFREKLSAYDQEIAHADAELGRLIDGLRQRGELDDTLIVFTADHGQSFGEHGYGGVNGAHGRKVYQSQVAVPLVMWMPGRVRQGTCDLPVSHVDLLPTIAELMALPRDATPAALPGSSLARVAQDASAPPPWGRAQRTRYGLAFNGAVGNRWNIFRWMQNKNVEHADPLCAYVLTDDGRKVIVDFANKKRVEVYDLKSDPAESANLAGQAVPQQQCQARSEELFAWYDHTRAATLTTVPPSAEDFEKLKALGYVE